MGLFSWLSGLWDHTDQQAANQASADINTELSPNSPYWQASQLTGDQGILQGAAQLQNANIGVDTSAVDADSDALNNLSGTFAGIQNNGGRVTQAAIHQAQANAANTGTQNLRANEANEANQIQDTDLGERNWAASNKTGTRAQVLANALKKQTWNMAVSHANFEAALAGKGIDNEDTNLAQALALSMGEGAQAARTAQRGTKDKQNAIDYNNAMQTIQMIGSAASQAAGGIAGMGSAAEGVSGAGGAAGSDVNSGYSATQMDAGGGTGDSAGYTLTGPVVGSQANIGTSVGSTVQNSKMLSTPNIQAETYVNPVSGASVNANYPSDTSAWASWLTDGSSLVA